MAEHEYVFRGGLKIPEGLSAQDVGERLELLKSRDPNGLLDPAAVREDALDHSSPLYRLYEANGAFDDTKTIVERYQLLLAKQIITTVKVRYREVNNGGPRTVRAFIRSEADRKAYEHVEQVVQRPEDRDVALRKAWLEMHRVAKKYRDLVEFAKLYTTLDEIEKALPPVAGSAA